MNRTLIRRDLFESINALMFVFDTQSPYIMRLIIREGDKKRLVGLCLKSSTWTLKTFWYSTSYSIYGLLWLKLGILILLLKSKWILWFYLQSGTVKINWNNMLWILSRQGLFDCYIFPYSFLYIIIPLSYFHWNGFVQRIKHKPFIGDLLSRIKLCVPPSCFGLSCIWGGIN